MELAVTPKLMGWFVTSQMKIVGEEWARGWGKGVVF